MKSFRFIFVGQAKNSSYKELETEYFNKVARYVRGSQLLFVKDGSDKNTSVRNDKEGQAFLEQVPASAHLVLCDESGKNFESPIFAQKLDTLLNERDVIVFGVGGAYGFSPAVKARATLTLRLAPWTLPHELARVVLLEQVYRAQTILRGEKYHHE